MKNTDDYYSCLLVKTKAHKALINKIEKLQEYENPALNSCRLVAGYFPGQNEQIAFAITLCEYICDKNNINLNETEFKTLTGKIYGVLHEMEEKIKKSHKKKF